MSKMVFSNDFVPNSRSSIKSVLDYEIEIFDPTETQYTVEALGLNYSVAGFEMVLTRKISFYIVTYYMPSGLFVVVSWIRCGLAYQFISLQGGGEPKGARAPNIKKNKKNVFSTNAQSRFASIVIDSVLGPRCIAH